MTHLEKLLKCFDEIGVHYKVKESQTSTGDYTCVYLANEDGDIGEDLIFSRPKFFEFRNGELASYP